MIDKALIKKIRAALERKLGELPAEAELGELGELRVTTGRYDPGTGSFRFVVEGAVRGGMNRDERDYRLCAALYGLDPDAFGKTFKHLTEEYRIVGLRPRARRYPVVVRRIRDGAEFRFPLATVRDFYPSPDGLGFGGQK